MQSWEILIQLGESDQDVWKHQQVLKKLPKQEEIQSEIKSLRKEIDALEAKSFTANARIQEREKLIDIEQEQINRLEEKMMRVRNQKEYLACKKEIETGKKVIKKMEDQILDFEEKKEALILELKNLHDTNQVVIQELEEKERKIAVDQDEIKKRIEDLQTTRNELLENIDTTWQNTYNQLVKRKIIPAVAVAQNERCGGCSMMLPAQLFNQIMKDTYGECPHCSRILVYVPPPEEEKEETPEKKDSKKKTSKKNENNE